MSTQKFTSNTECIQIEQVFKTYPDGVEALKDVSLSVKHGETLVIIGPSGSGKSTLLRCISGLEGIDAGRIMINGNNITGDCKTREMLRRDIGMVFQAFNLFPHLTVLENITLAPVKVRKIPLSEVRQAAFELLELVGLADKAIAYPGQLSGGQQQRVAIARALAMRPMVMLFDEATSALDPEMTGEVLAVMQKLSLNGSTMIVVTHEMGFAQRAGDRIVFMEGGQVIEESSGDSFFSNPSSERTKAFLGKLLKERP